MNFPESPPTHAAFLSRWNTVYPQLLAMVGRVRYPEKHEEETPHKMKCWTFLRTAFLMMGYPLPEDVFEAQEHFLTVPGVTGPYGNRQPMDLIYWAIEVFGERHVGLATRPGMMIHCSSETEGVAELELDRPMWVSGIRDTYRLKVIDAFNHA